MNKDLFYEAVRHPSGITPEAVGNLAEAVHKFPYFHAGWMLLLKGMHDNGSINFQTELRLASVHVWDRAALFWLVRGRMPSFRQRPVRKGGAGHSVLGESMVDVAPDVAKGAVAPEVAASDAPVADSSVIMADESIVGVGDVARQVSDVGDSSPVSLVMPVMPVGQRGPSGASMPSATDGGLFDYELPTENNEPYVLEDVDDSRLCRPDGRYTFGNWLEYVSQMQTAEAPPASNPTLDLIDRFLKQGDEHIVPVAERKSRKPNAEAQHRAEASDRENESILTETLANIYAKQHQFDKAINIYKKLMLKNPEKSSYFAARISDLEKSRNN